MSDTLCPKNFIKRDLNISTRKETIKGGLIKYYSTINSYFVLKICDGDCIKPQINTIILTSEMSIYFFETDFLTNKSLRYFWMTAFPINHSCNQ